MHQYELDGVCLIQVCHPAITDTYVEYLHIFRERLLNDPKFQFAEEAVNDFVQAMATLLDEVLLEFINRDLEAYRKEKGITQEVIASMTVKESEIELKRYFLDIVKSGTLYDRLLANEELHFSREEFVDLFKPLREGVDFPRGARLTVIDLLVNQFVANVELALKRILKDREELIRALQQIKGEIMDDPIELDSFKLIHAQCTGSDSHKFGQQVIILTLGWEDGKSGQLIYKPSSVSCDAVIVNNTDWFHQVRGAERVELDKSFFELINELFLEDLELLHKLDMPQLPTYLILPHESHSVHQSYGYKQFISCEPYPSLDIPFLAEQKFKTISPYERRRCREEFEDSVLNVFFRKLEDSSLEMEDMDKADCVTKSFDELCYFSRQCGMLFAIFYILKIGDMHVENMLSSFILSHKQMVPVDLENAFSQLVGIKDLDSIGSMDMRTGGFMSTSRIPVHFFLLFGIEGGFSDTLFLPGKNQLYLMDNLDNLQQCTPIEEDFLSGVKTVLQVILSQRGKVLHWLSQPYIKDIPVRVLPFNTRTLKGFRGQFCFRPIELMDTDGDAAIWASAFISIERDKGDALGNTDALIPRFCLINKKYIREESISYSLPIYFVRLDDTRVIDGKGEIVRFDERDAAQLKEALAELGSDVSWEDVLSSVDGELQYYEKSPLVAVKDSISALEETTISEICRFIENQKKFKTRKGVYDTYFSTGWRKIKSWCKMQ